VENVEEIISSISLNQVLMAVLQEHGQVSVPVLNFLEMKTDNKDLVVSYDESGPSFVFSIKDRNEQ
jgi:hypothetical protein